VLGEVAHSATGQGGQWPVGGAFGGLTTLQPPFRLSASRTPTSFAVARQAQRMCKPPMQLPAISSSTLVVFAPNHLMNRSSDQISPVIIIITLIFRPRLCLNCYGQP
jgi:hypothetical protein